MVLREAEKVLERSSQLLELLRAALQTDCITSPEMSARPSLSLQSTVGLMLVDLTIQGMIPGGPASNSRQLLVGDKILKVDGNALGPDDDYARSLIGSDIPGSKVILTVFSESENTVKTVSLRRMACSEMAERVKMFELFTTLHSLAVDSNQPELLACLQETVRLWSEMQATDASNLNRIIHEVSSRQDACIQMTLDLQANFERLHHVLQGHVFSHSGLEEEAPAAKKKVTIDHNAQFKSPEASPPREQVLHATALLDTPSKVVIPRLSSQSANESPANSAKESKSPILLSDGGGQGHKISNQAHELWKGVQHRMLFSPCDDDKSVPQLIDTCQKICEKLRQSTMPDALSLVSDMRRLEEAEPDNNAADASHRPNKAALTTVGLLVHGLTVANIVVGGPAYAAMRLSPGDVIINVDGQEVTEDTFPDAVVGCDVPGSLVTLRIIKESNKMEEDVSIRRMAREDMADHIKMFELLTTCKELAWVGKADTGYVDACISHWMRMLLSSASKESQAMKIVHSQHHSVVVCVRGLDSCLKKIRQLAERRTSNPLKTIMFRLKNMTVSDAFCGWKFKSLRQRRKRAIVGRALNRLMHQLASVAFVGWSEYYTECQRWSLQIGRVLRRICTLKMESALVAWREQAVRQNVAQVKCTVIALRMLNQTMFRTFQIWKNHIAEEKQIKTKGLRALLRLMSRSLASAFDRWHAYKVEQNAIKQKTIQAKEFTGLEGEVTLLSDKLELLKQNLNEKNEELTSLEIKCNRTTGELDLKSKALEASEALLQDVQKSKEEILLCLNKNWETWNETRRELEQSWNETRRDLENTIVQRGNELSERMREQGQVRAILEEATAAIMMMEGEVEVIKKEMGESKVSMCARAQARVLQMHEDAHELVKRAGEDVAKEKRDSQRLKEQISMIQQTATVLSHQWEAQREELERLLQKESTEKERLKEEIGRMEQTATTCSQQWEEHRKELVQQSKSDLQISRDDLEAVKVRLAHETETLLRVRNELDRAEERAAAEKEAKEKLRSEIKERDEQLKKSQDQILIFLEQVHSEQGNSHALLLEADERGKEMLALRGELSQSQNELKLKQDCLQGLERKLQESSDRLDAKQKENALMAQKLEKDRDDWENARKKLEDVAAGAQARIQEDARKTEKERCDWGKARKELEDIVAKLMSEMKSGEEMLSKISEDRLLQQRHHELHKARLLEAGRVCEKKLVMLEESVKVLERRALEKHSKALLQILKKMKNKALCIAFEAWSERTVRKKGMQRIALKVAQRLKNGSMVSSFDRWRDHIIEDKQMKTKASKVVRILIRMRNSEKYKALLSWEANVFVLRRSRRILQKSKLRWNNQAVSLFFDTWIYETKATLQELKESWWEDDRHEKEEQMQRALSAVNELEQDVQCLQTLMMRTQEQTLSRLTNGAIVIAVRQKKLETVGRVCEKKLVMLEESVNVLERRALEKHSKALLQILKKMKNKALCMAFEAWSERTVRKKGMQRIALKLVKNGALVSMFERWSSHIIEVKKMKGKALKVVQRIMNATLVQGFEVWKDKTTEEKQMKAKALKVVQRIMNGALVSMFERWSSHIIEVKKMKGKALKVVQRIMNATLVQGFEVWKDKTTEEKQMKAKALKVVQRIMNGALVSMFERWSSHIIEVKKMKGKALKVVQRIMNATLVQGFEVWKDKTTEEKQMKEKALKVVQRIMNGALVSMFERWSSHIIEVKKMKGKALKVVQRIMNATLVQGFEVWKDKTTEEKQMKAKALKVVQRIMNGALVSMFERWSSHIIEVKKMKGKALKVVQRIMNATLVQGFEVWKDKTTEEKQMKAKALKVVQRIMNGALVSMFERWSSHIIEEQQMKGKALKVVQRMMNGALACSFDRWKVAQQMRELEDVEKQLTMFEAERVELQRSCMHTENVLEDSRSAKAAMLENIEFLTQKLDEMEQDLTFLRDEIAVWQAAAVAKAQTLMVQMQNQALARLKEGAAALAAKDQELQALSSKLRITSQSLAEQTSQVDRQASDMTDLKQQLASISKQAADYTDDVQRLSSKLLLEQTSQVDRQALDITYRKKQLEEGEQKTLKSGEGGGEALREELNSLEAKLKVLRSSSDSVQQQLMQEIDMLKERLEEVAKNLEPVELIMTLGLDFSVAGSDGSVKREKFQCDVAQDLASASGLPPANFRINFRIKDVSPGSIILDMQVMPDPLAPGKHLEAAKYWAHQAVDISSKLRSGKITSHATGVEVRPSKEEEREKELSELKVQRDEAKRAHAQLANQVDFLTEELKSVGKLEAEVERLKAELDASTGELQVVTKEHVKSQRACMDTRKMLEDKEAVHAKHRHCLVDKFASRLLRKTVADEFHMWRESAQADACDRHMGAKDQETSELHTQLACCKEELIRCQSDLASATSDAEAKAVELKVQLADAEAKAAEYWSRLTEMETLSLGATKAAQLLNVRVRQDVLEDRTSVLKPQDVAALSASHKSTVGIMFDEMGFVQFLLPGGPAHASAKIVNGDQIIKVDGIQVDGNGLLQAITGSDIPGSSVTFTVQKPSGALVEVHLKRMSTAKVADTRRLFDLFTEINDGAKRDGDPRAIHCVRETIALWEAMLIAQYHHDENVSRNVLGMQRDCASWAEQVVTMLGTINGIQGWNDVDTECLIKNGHGSSFSSPALALTPPLPENDFISTGTRTMSDYHRFEDQDTDGEDNDEETPRSLEDSESEHDDLPITEFSTRKSKTIPSLEFSRRSRRNTFQLQSPDPSLVVSCRSVCSQLTEILKTNVLAVPSASISEGFNTKSTCGVMLIGTTIDNMVVGGPAYNSQKLKKGDVIVKVNGVEVDEESLHSHLIGTDVPGSFVKVTVMRDGLQDPMSVTLMRVATTAIADNVRMFELFTALKDQALMANDRGTESLIDQAIELWTAMLQSQAQTSDKLQENVVLMQGRSQQLSQQLMMLLDELYTPSPGANRNRKVSSQQATPVQPLNGGGSDHMVVRISPRTNTLNDEDFMGIIDEEDFKQAFMRSHMARSTTSHSSNPPSLYSSMTPSIYSSITPSQGRLWGKIDDEVFMEMIDQEREEDM